MPPILRDPGVVVLPDLAAVVLAAGLGTRLAPLTHERPKPLCPVAGVALVDLAVDRVAGVAGTDSIAVNVHHGREAMAAHLAAGAGAARATPVHVSVEDDRPLGTAGALGRLRPWIDGRDVVVVNSDAWCQPDLAAACASWDRDRILAVTHGDPVFGPRSLLQAVFLPWADVAPLVPEPSGLYEVSWRAAHAAGRIDAVAAPGPFVDCGTPARYLAANLLATGGSAAIDPSAVVRGRAEASVVWDGAEVGPDEVLVRSIRTTAGRTVVVR